MGRLVDRLPAPFKVPYWGEALWQWIGLVVCILATVLVGVAAFRLTKHLASRLKSPLDAWAMLLAPILSVFAVYQALRMVDIAINITGDTFQVGTVEQIGLLATRIRSLERTIVTVPNAEFSETKIDNFAVRDQRLLKTVLQLRYETTPEQLRYVLVKLRGLLLGHPKVTPAPARVRFINYGAHSKDVEVFAYLDCEDQDMFLAIQEDILLCMEDIVNDAGSGFAFPSQTAYLARDKGLDTRRQGKAEAEVGRWRGRGTLPFPEFDGDGGHRLEDVLDYPPRGSPGYRPSTSAYAAPRAPKGLTLSPDDIVDLPALAATLCGNHPVAGYLRGRLSEETRNLLSAYDGGRDPGLKDALVRDLNGVILGASIYDEHRFDNVTLREEAANLLAGNPDGEALARLSRLLLENAFPKEFAVKSESP